MDRGLDYFALIVLLVVLVSIIYGILYIHDIPYEIAKKRKHPHQDAIHTAGWVSLFLMHTIWPFLWIWATLYKPGVGWGLNAPADDSDEIEKTENQINAIDELRQRIEKLEAQLQSKEEA